MEADDDTRKLLEDMRDLQREHLAEYRRVTQLSLELQQHANARQEQFTAIYKRIVLVAGVWFAALLTLLVYLLVRWLLYLFR